MFSKFAKFLIASALIFTASAQKPLEPGEALRTFKVPDGFRMELVASEPLIASPVAIAYDENGNLYVAEMTDYPTPQGEPTGRIRLLRDLDGDGKFDTSAVFAGGLKSPSSIACWKGGIFVTTHGDLWYFKGSISSTNTQDRIELTERRKIFSGFGLGSLEYMQNNLQWGIDNKVYGATGPNGGSIQRIDTPNTAPVSLAGSDFAFDPMTLSIEPVSGMSQWGNAFDDSYNRFVCRNIAPARHVVLPLHYLKQNPFLRIPRLFHPLTSEEGDVAVFRISPPEPWRVLRARLRQELSKNANPGEINEAGYFTAACGLTVYRGAAYPPSYRGNLFIAEPAGNLVHRRSLESSGVTFKSKRLDGNSEVITSTDIFFRPVALVNAPDGTLHIVDMYREVVEDPKYVPEELIRSGKVDIRGGVNRGRIYRLTPGNWTAPKPPKLGKNSTSELVAHFQNPNAWWRETAQRLIYESQDRLAIGPLRQLFESTNRVGGLHALWALDRMNALTPGEIRRALNDASESVREHALRLAERHFATEPQLVTAALALKTASEPRIRLQLAFTLGEVKNAPLSVETEIATALAEIATRERNDPWVRAAILSSSFDHADKVFAALAKQSDFAKTAEGRGFLKELASTVGHRNRPDEIQNVLSSAARTDSACKVSIAAALADGAGKSPLKNDPASQAREVFNDALQAANSLLKDAEAPVDLRRDAIVLLGYGAFETLKRTATNLLSANQAEEVQIATVRALARHAQPQTPALLLDTWTSALPSVRAQILDTLLARAEWIEPLFASIEKGIVSPGMLDRNRRNQLLNHADASIRKRATALLGHPGVQSRDAAIQRYKSAGLTNGDHARGKLVFERACITCHRFGGNGYDIGPNLSAYGQESASAEKLLISILDPNREVAPNYAAYWIDLDNGQSLTGIIDTQTPGGVTLKQPGSAEGIVILRSEIKEIKSSNLSLMPEGFEESIDAKDMADLLAFLTAIRGGI